MGTIKVNTYMNVYIIYGMHVYIFIYTYIVCMCACVNV